MITTTKIICRFLMSLSVSFFYGPAIADYFNLAEHAWTSRLVIVVTDKKDTELERQAKKFFANNVCDINDRNLKFFYFNHDKMDMTQLPKKISANRGMWLIGYDGLIKDFQFFILTFSVSIKLSFSLVVVYHYVASVLYL